jgi:uncharacterized protein with HEPN domain
VKQQGSKDSRIQGFKGYLHRAEGRGQAKDISPDIERRKIAALRNILICEYFGVSLPNVWDIIQNKLDLLESSCRALLNHLTNF